MINIRFLMRKLKKYQGRLLVAVFFGILKESSLIAAIACLSLLIYRIRSAGPLPAESWTLLLGLLVLLRGVSSYLESYLSHDVAYHALIDLRLELFGQFMKLCPDLLIRSRTGQIAATLMNDVEQLEWFYAHTLEYAGVVLVTGTGMTLFLAHIHPLPALLYVLFSLLLLSIPRLLGLIAARQGLEMRRTLGDAGAVTLEGIHGLREILLLGGREAYEKRHAAAMEDLLRAQMAYAKRTGLEGALLTGISGMASILINIMGILLLRQGRIDSSAYAIFGVSVWLAFSPVIALGKMCGNLGSVLGACERVRSFFEQEPVMGGVSTQEEEPAEGAVSFHHVSFTYPAAQQKVLRDVSFALRRGTVNALVGPSGAGKTTVFALLERFYDPDEGAVMLGGVPADRIEPERFYGSIAAVLQDVYLFADTIRENIRIGRPSATDQEVVEAAKIACIHDFIETLPNGYDTMTGERGLLLSGGQRQRLAIARAILKDAPVLLMDEPGSSLDVKTDEEVFRAVRRHCTGKTILISAHRLSTVRDAERILVMDGGKIVQDGTYETLMAEKGLFRDLFASKEGEEDS